MKKILISSAILIFLSCTEKENLILEEQNIESINYIFNGETYKLDFEKNEENELIVIESEAQNHVDQLVDQNKNLIFHDVDENNIILFKSDIELNEYLESNGTPLSIKSEANRSSSPYTEGNLEMYIDSYFGGAYVFWDHPSYSETSCYQTGTMENRLKNFATTSNWIVRQTSGVSSCIIYYNNNAFGNNPNDKVSSLKVRNVFARFYEDANYRGRSITRDGRYGESSYNRLKSVRYRGSWNDRISSVKLSF